MLSKKINNPKDIKQAIEELEQSIKVKEATIKIQVADVKENLQPKRLFSNTFNYLAETPEIQKLVINTAIGFVIGYASKKTVELLSEASLNKSAESLVKNQITKLEQKNPDSLLSKGITLIRKFTPPSSPLHPFVKYD